MNTPAYQVRRSQRAKRARIIVSPEKIEVVAPIAMPEKQIQRFVQEKQAWIAKARSKVDQHVSTIASLAPENYQHGVMLPYQGHQYPLSINVSPNEALIKVDFSFDRFTISIAEHVYEHLSSQELNRHVRYAFIDWMIQAARSYAVKILDYYSPLYQLTPRSLTIKAVKSRWGSCGIHDDINLNWLLILAPAKVYEYVIIHELCHIQQRNHSAAFWALVAIHCPDYKQHRAWLKENGASLMLGL